MVSRYSKPPGNDEKIRYSWVSFQARSQWNACLAQATKCLHRPYGKQDDDHLQIQALLKGNKQIKKNENEENLLKMNNKSSSPKHQPDMSMIHANVNAKILNLSR